MTAAMCESCGSDLRQGARFCDRCGSSTLAVRHDADYRQVTVLFADVVRSMQIASSVDIERMREILTDVLESAAAVVRRYGGTVQGTGDGVMAIFGAPVAHEDHALRGCLAALAIQDESRRLAADVARRDHIELRLRVGLDSGLVIAGELGSGVLGYAATGRHVGWAQRMESVAPPGEVVLSESTVHLVEHLVVLAEPEWARVKGVDDPVRVRRLLAIGHRRGSPGSTESTLVGRHAEMAALVAMVGRAGGGRGGVVSVVGPPGIGKSRAARDTAAMAAGRGIEVVWTFCESHAREVPFHAVTNLVRALTRIADGDDARARTLVREKFRDGDADDVRLLDDLLGIGAADAPLPEVEPDARRRRLTALLSSALATDGSTLLIVEDAHWIDSASESMLAELFACASSTPSIVLVTFRPEYTGPLTQIADATTLTFATLSDSSIAELLDELLGTDPSLVSLKRIITERAAGNPFFAEEMVRELMQRRVLDGERGACVCLRDVAELRVPATVQAAIAARIDGLTVPAKRILQAAAVIGSRFTVSLLTALGVEPAFDELVQAEMVDRLHVASNDEYAFRHPLIRAVAYESQLRSDRAKWHRRVAAAIEERATGGVDESAALIAQHLERAGEIHAAYGWHMRAGVWSNTRALDAARLSWERARRLADALPATDDARLSMRIAPRTMLCATDFHAQDIKQTRGRYAELRELCEQAGDKVSLAIGMTGLATELAYTGRSPEGSTLASEQMSLLESIGQPALTMALAVIGFVNWGDAGRTDELLRWSHAVVELADGDPTRGAGFGVGSPLAAALAARSVARSWLGLDGWRQDQHDALAMARHRDPTTVGFVVAWTHGLAILHGMLQADDVAVLAGEEAVRIARDASNDHALVLASSALSIALMHRTSTTEQDRGVEQLARLRDTVLRQHGPFLVPIADAFIARATAERGDVDAALGTLRAAVAELQGAGRHSVAAASMLVQTLLERGADADLVEAEEAIGRMTSRHDGSAVVEITLARLRALLAGARDDAGTYRDAAAHYYALADSLDFEGHLSWARDMMNDAARRIF
ncbi:adenylate/guanylate cyclase domain-containing protein [Mycolicibacterium arenosum]|uniref:AAA family ATPase n=1 Tax=Mycolicibacterium arenosum TaxID=2952157 RepID=A0ABT1M722_9MYCO|nr:adenylate/guanylate cyclase domain-containing protein [Mycolicibacterium sp. CAU 1645]MCP9274019.1 AAA family ATPase [Mycolicibacterium sp. CAU 1645]